MSRKLESFETLKQNAISGRMSVATIESKMKKEFRERLKDLRRKNIDLRREDIANNFLNMNIVPSEEKISFANEYYSYEESLQLLNEIEEEIRQELLNQQAEAFQQDCENEILYFVENLYNPTM